jgi:nucleotide-binding universal stress UspA family protein
MFQRILIGTDLRDGFQRFGHCIEGLAKAGVEQLVFLYSKPISAETTGRPKLDPTEVAQIQQRILQQVTPNPQIEVKVEVQLGKPVDCLLQAAKTYQSDVIILGTASKNPLSETLFGSTTRELAQRTEIPLMIFRPPAIAMMTIEELSLRCQHLCRSILLPYDGSAASIYVVNQLQTLAQQKLNSISDCTLCWVSSDSSFAKLSEAEQRKVTDEKLASAEQQLSQAGIQVDRSVRSGSAILEILAAAGERDVSAIAIASNSLGKLVEWTTPSLTGELLRRSWYPVIFFPQR